MKANKGFTLIEILIALAIFAILATLTSSVLYQAFNARARVNIQADKLSNLQMAVSLLQQDIVQAVNRPIRGNDMHLFPGFVGQPSYVEFTRDGSANPKALEQRSTLKRIAFVCEDNKLLRRTWATLDPLDRNVYDNKILLDNLTNCSFAYVNQALQTLTEWRENAVNQNQSKEPLPKAIQVNLSLQDWGNISLLFIIPGALYGGN